MTRVEGILALEKFIEELNDQVKAKGEELGIRDAHIDCWAFSVDRSTMDQLPNGERHHHEDGSNEFWTKKLGRVTLYCYEPPIEVVA